MKHLCSLNTFLTRSKLSHLLSLIKRTWPNKVSLLLQYGDTHVPLTLTNTFRGNSKTQNNEDCLLLLIWDFTPVCQTNRHRATSFWTIYCTIVTVCSHIVCTQHSCVCEVFFFFFYNRKTTQGYFTQLQINQPG